MSYRSSLKQLAAVAIFGTLVGFSTMASASVQFLDLQWLNSGITTQQAGSYFKDKLDPIVRRHGGKIIFVYQILGTMKGEVKPAIAASMEFPSMDEMQALFKDPEYQKIVPQRDATFDLPRQSLFQVTPIGGMH